MPKVQRTPLEHPFGPVPIFVGLACAAASVRGLIDFWGNERFFKICTSLIAQNLVELVREKQALSKSGIPAGRRWVKTCAGHTIAGVLSPVSRQTGKASSPKVPKRGFEIFSMELTLNTELVKKYKSAQQKIRVLTEDWVDKSIFCPNCGQSKINQYPNNQPVADYYCSNCKEEYELKSHKNKIGAKIVDGAYIKMLERLTSANNPNLFLLNYDLSKFSVANFFIIPKHFFVPEIIIKRNKGIPDRPNYIMCSIDLSLIPQSGKIYFIRNKQIEPKEKVIAAWKKTLFLREEKEMAAKSWLLDIMRCVEKIDKREFSLAEIYLFENELKRLHPMNMHIKDKIRQQLQILRDSGYLQFVSRGYYRLV